MSATTWTAPPGTVGNLTVPQQHTLDKLKKDLQDSEKFVESRMTDAYLLRFCRARKFDFELTKTMLLAAEQWRVDFGIDEIVKNFDFKEQAEVNKYYPSSYHGVDKDGRPIWIEQLGKLDIKALYAVTTSERQLQRLVYEYEKFLSSRLPACSEAAGHPVETSCTILDLNNVSLSNFYKVKDYVMSAASIGQDRYPETMGKFYIINAPYLFSGIWTLVKPWLDEVTVKKIQIISSAKEVQKALQMQIAPDQLPKLVHAGGGVCECPEGCGLSDKGPWNKK